MFSCLLEFLTRLKKSISKLTKHHLKLYIDIAIDLKKKKFCKEVGIVVTILLSPMSVLTKVIFIASISYFDPQIFGYRIIILVIGV